MKKILILSVTNRNRKQAAIITAKNLLSNYPVQGMVSAISAAGQSQSLFLNFPNQSFSQSVLDGLSSAVEISPEKNLLKGHQGYVNSVAISINWQTIVSGVQMAISGCGILNLILG